MPGTGSYALIFFEKSKEHATGEAVPGHPGIRNLVVTTQHPASVGGADASAKHESTRATNRAEPLVAAVLDQRPPVAVPPPLTNGVPCYAL